MIHFSFYSYFIVAYTTNHKKTPAGRLALSSTAGMQIA